MIHRLAVPAIALLLAGPGFAEQIEIQPRTDHATVFPQGASVSWSVDIAADPGTHQLILPGLPAGFDPATLRVAADGARIGAISLQSNRALPGSADEPQAVTSARAALIEVQDALVSFDSVVAGHHADAQALREQAEIVRDLLRGDSRTMPEDLKTIADTAGELIVTYYAKAQQLQREADLKSHRRGQHERAVQRAEQQLAAVLDSRADRTTVLVTVETTRSPASLRLSGFTTAAGWHPAYDLRLDRTTGRLTLERGLVVTQASGGDWQDVTLTLSTTRPSDRAMPTDVPSWFPRIIDPGQAPQGDLRARKGLATAWSADEAELGAAADAALPPPIIEAATAQFDGLSVVYDYPAAVTIRDGADALRLRLDEKQLSPEIFAEIAPRFDSTAFLIAETVNPLDEPILPGPATLYLDGAMVGQENLDLIVPGDDLRIGFGALDGITAELRIPDDSEGDSGIIRRASRRALTERLITRNLTDEDWPLRVVDRVPVSGQEDLTISWTAEPDPGLSDPDGRRGVLYWQHTLPAGDSLEITLTTEMRWPEGKILVP